MNDQLATGQADDERFMRLALALGRRNLGNTWPNPAVGAVIVKDGIVIARGWTQEGGRPHAEVEALRRAKKTTQGATMYVSLEPCSHQGKTPPCADAIVRAGIARVVSAMEDPNPEVAGQGHERLRAKGVREGLAPVTLGEVARISMILDPDGNWIELSRRASIVGSLTDHKAPRQPDA